MLAVGRLGDALLLAHRDEQLQGEQIETQIVLHTRDVAGGRRSGLVFHLAGPDFRLATRSDRVHRDPRRANSEPSFVAGEMAAKALTPHHWQVNEL